MLSRSRRASDTGRHSTVPECVESSLAMGAERKKAVVTKARLVCPVHGFEFALVLP